ncbi:MAG: exodeoxyribonuclease III [Deltaproteobacteria bacterium]|nr:exodeoxyribonuclease III [Deltaproteobacteria bacterium]
MRVITINVNGVRSATAKGLWSWLGRQRADVVCLQETRAGPEELPAEVGRLDGWHRFFRHADRPGYSGVALLARRRPDRVMDRLGFAPFDREGRYLRADFGDLSVVSLYVPSGTTGDERQAFKMRCLARLSRHLRELRRAGRHYLLCGDLNIAHTKADIENWRGNQNHSGFLPEERAWLDRLFGPEGWTDAFRVVDQRPRQYTWWSNRGRAWENNVGWRIDYQVASPALGALARSAAIYKRQRFSDHAPLCIDYDYEL